MALPFRGPNVPASQRGNIVTRLRSEPHRSTIAFLANIVRFWYNTVTDRRERHDGSGGHVSGGG